MCVCIERFSIHHSVYPVSREARNCISDTSCSFCCCELAVSANREAVQTARRCADSSVFSTRLFWSRWQRDSAVTCCSTANVVSLFLYLVLRSASREALSLSPVITCPISSPNLHPAHTFLHAHAHHIHKHNTLHTVYLLLHNIYLLLILCIITMRNDTQRYKKKNAC